MKVVRQLWVLMLIWTPVLFAQTASWEGQLNGAPIVSELALQGDDMTGHITVQGYRYRVQATNSDSGAQGVLIDQSGVTIPLVIQMQGSALAVQAYNEGIDVEPLEFLLHRVGSSHQGGSQSSSQARAKPAPNAVAPAGQLDPALVGLWVYSESYTSNDFGGSYQEKAYFYPDGRLGIGSAVGAGNGGAHVYGNDSGPNAFYRWQIKVQPNGNRHLYIEEAGSWQLYGRYYIEDGRMLVTKADGSREFWRRG